MPTQKNFNLGWESRILKYFSSEICFSEIFFSEIFFSDIFSTGIFSSGIFSGGIFSIKIFFHWSPPQSIGHILSSHEKINISVEGWKISYPFYVSRNGLKYRLRTHEYFI